MMKIKEMREGGDNWQKRIREMLAREGSGKEESRSEEGKD